MHVNENVSLLLLLCNYPLSCGYSDLHDLGSQEFGRTSKKRSWG